MPKKKTRTAIVAAAALCLALGATVLVVRYERSVHFQRFQGAWEGAMHFHGGQIMCVQRVVLKIFKQNNAYRATVDLVDIGYKDLPTRHFDFGSRTVNFELTNGIIYRGLVDPNTLELRGRWKWPGGYSQPLALSQTNAPDAVPSPLAEADYAQRSGSDLQGQWTGSVLQDNQPTPLRLGLKIAEAADGSFRAEVNNLNRADGVPWPVTYVTYRQPHVKFEIQGVGILFEGDLDDGHSRMRGTIIFGKPYAMTFERVSAKAATSTNSMAEVKI